MRPLWRSVCGVLPHLEVRPLWRWCASCHPSQGETSCGAREALSHRTSPMEISTRKSVNFGIKSSSPRVSVISIPELFTYALYFVIAFVLEVIYLAITSVAYLA